MCKVLDGFPELILATANRFISSFSFYILVAKALCFHKFFPEVSSFPPCSPYPLMSSLHVFLLRVTCTPKFLLKESARRLGRLVARVAVR